MADFNIGDTVKFKASVADTWGSAYFNAHGVYRIKSTNNSSTFPLRVETMDGRRSLPVTCDEVENYIMPVVADHVEHEEVEAYYREVIDGY
jgi:hypothetical protein